MRLVFFGPPGGGKGTQAERIKKDAHVVPIATGDLLREAVAAGTDAGKRANEFMVKGALVPDEVVNAVLKDRLLRPDAKEGFLLDGYPRTMGQLNSLEALLKDVKMPIDKWVFIDVPRTAVEERVLGRRTCTNKQCQRSYHIKFNPPRKPDVCDACEQPLYVRPDDNPEKLKTRLDAYTKDTVAVIEQLKKQGKLITIDAGTKSIDEAEKLVRSVLGLKAK